MSTNDPDEIRRDIDRTRANLSYDVNALADEASPRQIARRQVRKVRSGAGSLRERLFGSDDDDIYYDAYGYERYHDTGFGSGDTSSGVSGIAHQAREGVSDVAHGVRDAAADAPRQLRRRTQGAPLALGLVAFGLGGVVAALMPASEPERRAAQRVKEQAAPLVEEAKAVAQEAVENVKPVAQDAMSSVQETARSGAETVREDARSSADTVKQDAARAKGNVTGGQGPGY
ncbi:Protein of unknown function [Raineyella antarctica]|uniref:DUF3618 domain-containing protein n=1 Tax=Raineyella antarctica TaxID=1577474 RepID=A0A1G6H3Z0_9ACTN|nr:DUF3618 domain-containing protein [Raineyella antarctica]SDB89010.1 Protein of unknown function [Raineyella antarctica]